MAGFFRSLFGTGTERQEPTLSRPVPPIEQMSVDEILTHLKSLGETVNVKESILVLDRLYDIALYEHHVPAQQRNAAHKYAEVLKAEIENSLSGDPDALASLQAANDFKLKTVRLHGIGSLNWKIQEESVPAADTIPYVMRPEHRHLVPDYFEAIGKETVLKLRNSFVRVLILAEQYKAYSAVLILHGVAAKGDKAAAALLAPEEYSALLAVPNNYDAGRRVLVALGLLPDTSSARPFKQIFEPKEIVGIALAAGLKKTASDNRLAKIPDEQREALLLALNSLRFYLAYDIIRQIYGEEMSNSLMDICTEQTTKQRMEQLGRTMRALIAMPPGTPVDLMFLDSVLDICGIATRSEEDRSRNQAFVDMGAEWLNQERVEFQGFLRFMLRTMGDHIPQIRSAADEEIAAFVRDTYRQLGASAGLAENAIYFEDWIGTE